jgi:hypothetical protein
MADVPDPEVLASQLTATIVAARVGSATARPSRAEAEDAAQYYRVMLAEVRRGLGLDPAEDGSE